MRCYCALCCVCFVFKQKTAYELRISDCSSDVCSSDLLRPLRRPVSSARPFLPRPLNSHVGGTERVNRCVQFQRNVRLAFRVDGVDCRLQRGERVELVHVAQGRGEGFYGCGLAHDTRPAFWRTAFVASDRKSKRTSELQSPMRISYAVFCLKKKKSNHMTNT